MEIRTIVIYSSVDGQTKKICDLIRSSLIKNNEFVEMFNINGSTLILVVHIANISQNH
jgi:menaquinone-dependent protoporphyrinogen oxidase